MNRSELNARAMAAMYKSGRIAGNLDITHPRFMDHLECSNAFLGLAISTCQQCDMSRDKLWRIRDFGAEEAKNDRGFIQGENDCKAGLPHCEGVSKEYDDGYGLQYSKEQVIDNRTSTNER